MLFAQVVDSVILKKQDVMIVAAKSSKFSKSVSFMKVVQISEIGTGKFPVGKEKYGENTGNL